ncbi:MAG: tetratricopeptide repeat protein, partial [Sulfuricella sp.]
FPEAHNNLGTLLQARKRFEDAGKSFEQALRLRPNYAEACFNAGNVNFLTGKYDVAAKRFELAIKLRPNYAKAYCGLGQARQFLGLMEKAEKAFQKALELQPNFAEAHGNYAALLRESGRLDEAEKASRRALELNPNKAESWNGLGELQHLLGQMDEAEAAFRRATALKPDYSEAHNNLGVLLAGTGRMEEAMTSYQTALTFDPNLVNALNNIGILFTDMGRLEDAMNCYQKVLAQVPEFWMAHSNLGNIYRERGQIDEARKSYQQALQINPDESVTQNNLGTILMAEGKLDEARDVYRRAMEINPGYAVAHSNLIFMLDFDPAATVEMQQAERRKWGALHAAPLRNTWRPHGNTRRAERKLRIGYVSADFRMHSAAYAFEPLLCFYDRDAFEVFCYSNSPRKDQMTLKFHQSVDHWREVYGVSDEQMAEMVRRDEIDILVDLSGHSAGNRLLMFARKPAPVQATGWGHANGTGLEAMDYLASDPVSIPNEARQYYAEEIIDLPCQIPYASPSDSPPVSGLAAKKNAFLTYGCFNRLAKMTEENFALWAEIMKAVPDSRLMLKAKELSDTGRQTWVRERFAGHGIAPERLILAGQTTWYEHMQHFNEVDIALDPFPYGGGVSTYESLWMGCPVVALKGQTLTGRIAAAIECALGMEDWVADSETDYVQLAVTKAENPDALKALRSTLRARLQVSPLGDAGKYATLVEENYRRIWKIWCHQK